MDDMASQQKILIDILEDPSVEAKKLPFSLFENITSEFAAEREVGRGAFGIVYKGVLSNGMVVAVKRLNLSGQVFDDNAFHAEVKSMEKLSHKNVVRLLGYCLHAEKQELTYNGQTVTAETNRQRLLCFQFVPNGTIQTADASKGNWPKRYEVIKGICYGLEYIHGKGYLHLDLKPLNVLLDKNMVPLITDFGLARFFGDQQTRNTVNNHGSLGFMAPEYVRYGVVSKKADIFSLGVVIFEIITGARGPKVHETTQNQKEMFLQRELLHWKREFLRVSYTGSKFELACQQVETCLKVALNCTDDDRDCRRTIGQILHIIDLALDPYILVPPNIHIKEAVFVKQCDLLEDGDLLEDVALHPSRPLILLCLSSGRIEILDYQNNELTAQKLSDKPVHSAKFLDGDGWNFVAGDGGGDMHVWESKEGHLQRAFESRSIKATGGKAITSLAVHPSKHYILLSAGSIVMIWNTKDWTCSRMFSGPGYFNTVTHAAFNTNNETEFGIGCGDGSVKLWSYAYSNSNRRPYLALHGHSAQVCSISYYTRDSEMFVVTGSMDKTAKVWMYDNPSRSVAFDLPLITEPAATLQHEDGVTATCYNPQLNIILTGTNHGVVSIWCSRTYRRKRILCSGLTRIRYLECLMGKRLFIGHERGLVQIQTDSEKL